MWFDLTVQFATSRMTVGDAVMAEDEHSLLERMVNEDLWIGVNCADKKSVFIIGKGQPPPPVKTTTDVGENMSWYWEDSISSKLIWANCDSSSRSTRVVSKCSISSCSGSKKS